MAFLTIISYYLSEMIFGYMITNTTIAEDLIKGNPMHENEITILFLLASYMIKTLMVYMFTVIVFVYELYLFYERRHPIIR